MPSRRDEAGKLEGGQSARAGANMTVMLGKGKVRQGSAMANPLILLGCGAR
jgi:hypothetical protein